MNKSTASAAISAPMIETLESRALLSVAAPALQIGVPAAQSNAIVASRAVRNAATKTTVTAVADGTVSAPITFTVTVRAAAAAGSPEGTVNILDHRNVIETITLAPTTSTNPKFAFSEGTVTLTQTPGGVPYFFGKHAVNATFVPSGAFKKSSAPGHFIVPKPVYTALSDGVEYQTVTAGSGTAVSTGQTADVLYTGFFARNGRSFDNSIKDGGSPFTFQLGAGMAITGFDEGTTGMQVGETRVVLIPPAEGYGSKPYNGIPGNSTLIFVITLESFSS